MTYYQLQLNAVAISHSGGKWVKASSCIDLRWTDPCLDSLLSRKQTRNVGYVRLMLRLQLGMSSLTVSRQQIKFP